MSKMHPLFVNCVNGKISFNPVLMGCWHTLCFNKNKRITKIDQQNAQTAAQYFRALHKVEKVMK